jgi:hypothetical protein
LDWTKLFCFQIFWYIFFKFVKFKDITQFRIYTQKFENLFENHDLELLDKVYDVFDIMNENRKQRSALIITCIKSQIESCQPCNN